MRMYNSHAFARLRVLVKLHYICSRTITCHFLYLRAANAVVFLTSLRFNALIGTTITVIGRCVASHKAYFLLPSLDVVKRN